MWKNPHNFRTYSKEKAHCLKIHVMRGPSVHEKELKGFPC